MDFALTEEQEEIRALARRIFRDRATTERLKEIEAGSEGFDRDLWRDLAASNLVGVALPEDTGGSGFGLIELCLLLEEAAAAVAPVPLHPVLITALTLAAFGTPEQRSRLLGPVASGDALVTAALAGAEVSAVGDGPGWKVTGVLDRVPVAHAAEWILVPARTGRDELGIFLVDPSATKVERQGVTSGEPVFRVVLDASVPPEDVVAAPPKGGEVLEWARDRSLAALCVMQAGFTERALRITADYTSGREQFGRPLATFQAVQQRLADAYIDVEALRWTAWRAAWRLSQGLPADEEIAVAKFWAAEAGHLVTTAAQHLHGGIGVDVDYPLHRFTKHAKQVELAAGGATEQLAALGDLIAESA